MKKINRNATETITVSWPKQLKKDVFQYAQSRDLSVSQLTKQVLGSYILRKRLEEIQRIVGPKLKKLGINTDEDVEKYFG